MGGDDRNDAFTGNCKCFRKTFKWTVKVVMHFIEEAALNTFILYNKTYPNKMHFMNFKIEVIESTVARACLTEDDTFEHPTLDDIFWKLHPLPRRKNPQKRCFECTKRGTRKESQYQYKNCASHPDLCTAPWRVIQTYIHVLGGKSKKVRNTKG